jgi:hypothetical protein
LKLAVAALIRNEIDIVGSFLQHLDALFDHVLLMDHGSIDGTDRVMEQACAQRPGWTLWRLEPIGYHQAAFNIFALRHLMRHTDADVAMFLDADEFINVPDSASLQAALAGLTDPDRIGHMYWRNVVPDRLDTRTISPGETIWRAPNTSILGKVVIPRRFLVRHNQAVTLGIGNHGLYFDPQHMVPVDQVGEILHLPIRSHAQLRSKVLAGVFSIMAQADRLPAQSWHWFDILWRIADGTLRDEDVIGIAAQYSEQGRQGSQALSWAELQASGFIRTSLEVAFGRPPPTVTEPLPIDTMRLIATILRRFQIEDVRNCELALDGNRVRFVHRPASVDPVPIDPIAVSQS